MLYLIIKIIYSICNKTSTLHSNAKYYLIKILKLNFQLFAFPVPPLISRQTLATIIAYGFGKNVGVYLKCILQVSANSMKTARQKSRMSLLKNKQQHHKEITVLPWFLLVHKACEIPGET